MRLRLTPTLFVTGLLLSRPSAEAQRFYPDDPIQRDNDNLDTPEKPASIELGDLYDRVSHITKDFGSSEIGSEARNVNTLDEVPDSNWFTKSPRNQPHESRRAQARLPCRPSAKPQRDLDRLQRQEPGIDAGVRDPR